MKHVTALQLRQSLGKIVASLQKSGEPILLHKGRKPVAALISLVDFHERFVERAAAQQRQQILDDIDRMAIRAKDTATVVEVLRELRET